MTLPPSDLHDQLQATLRGSYTLERELGGGGMSRVFVAEELRLKRRVVVKVLSPELAQGINVERFEREIQTVAALQHANIVPVLTAGDTDGLPFYTMPFVEGESLRARLGGGPLAVTEVIGILRDVSKALAYAHQRGVVHRDIKPDNVLISGGVAVVTDFGIAKAISAARTSSRSETLTQIGTSIGTPAYMAPEQAAGDPDIDGRADIYSLGAMAYELLSGKVVFADRTAQRMLAAHMSEAPTPINALRPDMSAPLAALVMQCLAKSPDDRPQSAADIARVLDTVSSGSAHEAMPPLLGGSGMFRKALAIYAVTFVVVAIVAKAAIVGIGLPDWVFPGALLVMALGLPMLLWTGYVQRVSHRAMMTTPTFTPGGHPNAATHGTLAGLAIKAAPKMSWSKTARGGAYALGAFVVVIGVFMAMRALGIGPVGTLFASGKLKATDRLVLTDFTSTNGDSSVARAASIAVRSALQQSALEIMDPATVAEVLERMERPRTSRIDLPTAREVATREGAKAIIDGEVTAVGTGYLLTLRLLTADSGKTLGTFPASANGLEGLIPAADKVTKALRASAGESLRSVQNAVPLARAQTASLEALRLFGESRFANSVEGDFPKALRLGRAAVAIDSSFAQGWALMGIVSGNMGLPRAQRDSEFTRAYALIDRLPATQQDFVAAEYFSGPGRDRAKAIDAYWREIRDGGLGGRNNLANLYQTRREFGRADSLHRAAAAADSTQAIFSGNLQRDLISEGRLDSADSLSAVGMRRYPNNLRIRQETVTQAFYHGQLDVYQHRLDSARASPDPRDPAWAYLRSSELALLGGHIATWRDYQAKTLAADSALGRRTLLVAVAVRNVLVASRVRGVDAAELRTFDEALARSNLKLVADADRPDLDVALNLALAGHVDRARALLTGFRSTVRDTAIVRDAQPAIHTVLGAIAAAEHRLPDALRELRRGDSLPDGPANACTICLPLYLGHAFDAANRPDSAIIAYESYIRLPMEERFAELLDASSLPGVHERLGQLYEAKGDAQKAVEHYRAFIELWKNADSELQPRVAAARRSVAKLTAAERGR